MGKKLAAVQMGGPNTWASKCAEYDMSVCLKYMTSVTLRINSKIKAAVITKIQEVLKRYLPKYLCAIYISVPFINI